MANTLHAPPDNLDAWQLPLIEVDRARGSHWYRLHRITSAYSPVSYNFGAIDDRFNAPAGEYGILYLGGDPYCSFIETFGSAAVGGGYRMVSDRRLSESCLCRIDLAPGSRPLRLVNIATGAGLSRLGLDGRISTSKERAITREWALALWRHPQRPDGLLYTACNDPARTSVALFDRCGDVLVAGCDRENLLRDRDLLAKLLDHYDYGLV